MVGGGGGVEKVQVGHGQEDKNEEASCFHQGFGDLGFMSVVVIAVLSEDALSVIVVFFLSFCRFSPVQKV